MSARQHCRSLRRENRPSWWPVRILVLAVVFVSVACGSTPERGCAGGERTVVNDMLYFGTAMPDGNVSPHDWSEFLNAVATPRFPQGLTVWPASGQWRSDNGSIVREGTYVLTLVHPDDRASEEAIRQIVELYKSSFRQEAVLRVRTIACASP